MFSDAQASLAPTPVMSELVGKSVTDSHCVGVTGPLQNIRRPRDVIHIFFESYDELQFPKSIFEKFTRSTHLLSFASLSKSDLLART